MFQRCDSKNSRSHRAFPDWLGASDRQVQAAAVLGVAKNFQARHRQPVRGSTTASSKTEPCFDRAVELYEDGDWKDAFAAAVGLADRGHAAAAHLALLMLRYGAPLYGITLQAEPRKIAKWAQLVLRAKAVERRRVGPPVDRPHASERRSMTAVA